MELKILLEGQPIYINGFFYVKSNKPIEDGDVVFDRRDGVIRRVVTCNIASDLVVLDMGTSMDDVYKDNVYKLQHINPRDN